MRQIVTYRQPWIGGDRLIRVHARKLAVDQSAVATGDYVQFVDDDGERFLVERADLAKLSL